MTMTMMMIFNNQRFMTTITVPLGPYCRRCNDHNNLMMMIVRNGVNVILSFIDVGIHKSFSYPSTRCGRTRKTAVCRAE